jgi:hypothetical protein
MSFDPQITLWTFRTPQGLQLPKWESTWERVGSFPHTLAHSHECECDSWVVFPAHTFPCLCFSREPKVKVMALNMGLAKKAIENNIVWTFESKKNSKMHFIILHATNAPNF